MRHFLCEAQHFCERWLGPAGSHCLCMCPSLEDGTAANSVDDPTSILATETSSTFSGHDDGCLESTRERNLRRLPRVYSSLNVTICHLTGSCNFFHTE